MSHVSKLLALALLCMALACTACKQSTTSSTTSGKPGTTAKADDRKYPIPQFDREYTDIHDSAKQAWFLVETSYFVVSDKYKAAKGGKRQAVTEEIEKNIFGVNDKIEALFKDAIAKDPKNPLNHATYAMYLMPRKRKAGADYEFVNAEADAMAEMDKAIDLQPDDAMLHLMKIRLMVEPRQTHDWVRSGYEEGQAIATQLDEINRLFVKAEQYYPQNSYVNYYRAVTLFTLTPPDQFDTIRTQLIGEIRAGNKKKDNYFVFPPPLSPWESNVMIPTLWGTETEAVWYDHWNQYGSFSGRKVSEMVDAISKTLTWPEDRDEITELMFFLYNIGRTQPYDRSYFNWQQRLLDRWQSQVEPGSSESLKLARAARFLTEQYHAVGTKFYEVKVLTDPTEIDVRGVEKVELGPSRKGNFGAAIQPRQAAYLKRFGEIFNIKFPLYEDPDRW